MLLGSFVAFALGMAGCASNTIEAKKHGPQEKFGAIETYSRLFDAPPAQTCEAARRALLSQGYLVSINNPQWIEGKKSFQPDAESHLEMMIRVVCVPDDPNEKISLAFTTAVQDSYALKKSSNSASLGLGGIGSVSVPISANNDGLTKVGSETITATVFYDRFFELVKQYLLANADAQ